MIINFISKILSNNVTKIGYTYTIKNYYKLLNITSRIMSTKTPSCLLNRTPGKNIGIKQKKKYEYKKCSQYPCRFT